MGHAEQETSEEVSVKKTDVLKDFQLCFFSMSRLASFPWTFLEENLQSDKSSALISDILKQTCVHPLCRKFPPSVRYRRLFLSELIKRQEAAGCDPLDELYDALAEVVGAEDPAQCYKSYLLPAGGAVSLQESVALISEGTTGLVTWEAALHLAEWALEQREVFTGRTVLELGSGVGLTGITICRSCSPSRFVFSDCHPSVLQRLRANVRLNGLTERGEGEEGEEKEEQEGEEKEQTAPVVSVEELDWAEVTEERVKQIGADVVIAADVVYDPEVAGRLVQLLSRVLSSSSPDVFVCSTLRNPQTYGGFKQQLGEAGIGHLVIPGPVARVFPYDRLSPIETLRLFT